MLRNLDLESTIGACKHALYLAQTLGSSSNMRSEGMIVCLVGSCIAAVLILILLPVVSILEGSPLFRAVATFGLLVLPIFASTKIAYRSGIESVNHRKNLHDGAP